MSTNGKVRLWAEGLSKSFGEVVALENADFNLRAGEIMALVGENGAGKSTFVKILCGIYRRDSGAVWVEGETVELGTSGRAEKAGIAVVQQELSVVPTLSVAENTLLGQPSERFLMSKRQMAKQAQAYLETVELDVDPNRPAGELPLAEQQMLEIARVVSRDAGIILLDEPTAALSDDDIARVKKVVLNLAADGRSVVYITHRLGEVFDLADRVTVFRDGRSQEPVDVAGIDNEELITRMLGRPLVQMFPPRSGGVGDTVLEIRDLETKGVNAPVSLQVRKGEILGLAGQLGSGISAILRGVSGTQPVQSGVIEVEGTPREMRTPAEAQANGVAYCSGDRKHDGFFSSRRVTENFTAPGIKRITPMGFLRRRTERQLSSTLASLVSFDRGRLRHRVETLSGGNQQKVTVGKWLGVRPMVLLIDEPTRGVDVGARAEIYRSLRELADGGLAVIFASSEMHEIQGLADSVVTFFRGRAVSSYRADEVDHPTLIRDITR